MVLRGSRFGMRSLPIRYTPVRELHRPVPMKQELKLLNKSCQGQQVQGVVAPYPQASSP